MKKQQSLSFLAMTKHRLANAIMSDAQPGVYKYASLTFVNLKLIKFKKGAAVEQNELAWRQFAGFFLVNRLGLTLALLL